MAIVTSTFGFESNCIYITANDHLTELHDGDSHCDPPWDFKPESPKSVIGVHERMNGVIHGDEPPSGCCPVVIRVPCIHENSRMVEPMKENQNNATTTEDTEYGEKEVPEDEEWTKAEWFTIPHQSFTEECQSDVWEMDVLEELETSISINNGDHYTERPVLLHPSLATPEIMRILIKTFESKNKWKTNSTYILSVEAKLKRRSPKAAPPPPLEVSGTENS
ncbi:hypothetical protein ACOME3_002036 [Neoechinorhynchus agilis]